MVLLVKKRHTKKKEKIKITNISAITGNLCIEIIRKIEDVTDNVKIKMLKKCSTLFFYKTFPIYSELDISEMSKMQF